MNADLCHTGPAASLADAVFAELAHALSRLAATGEEMVVDLRSLPFGPTDLAALSERLGTGEVTCTLEVAGRSEVRETGFAGIWWVRHLGDGDEVAGEEVHVTRIPEILSSHPDDVAFAARRIADAVTASPQEGPTAADEEDISRG
ncbi:MAG: hydrogenase expression/formation protein [Siculibacillus sp.]|nr:hydrogenase expression/formation protein [Siculibacillus sp.]